MSVAAAVSDAAAVSFTNVPLIPCDKLVDEHAISNVGSFSWFLPLLVSHTTLTPFAIKYPLVPPFLHMILFVNSYYGSPFLNLSLHLLLRPFLFQMILLHWFPILIIAVDEEVVEAIAPALGVTIAKGLVMLRSNAEPRQINSSLRF
ncbi:pleckstrin-like proteiny domain-containing family B member 1 isoform [Sesbania bispinosa]|nr:pleckstrin-like proteiny domain-containing family B member 1 isoform [Sesbania bispinosa]